MSFNRQLVPGDLDLQGNELLNAKPQHLDKHTITLGIVHFNILEKMEAGKNHTYSAYMRIDPDSTVDNQTVHMSFQGNSISTALKCDLTRDWKRYVITQPFTAGNNNPRFYGIAEFNVTNIMLEEGDVASDWNLDPDDVSFVFNRLQHVENYLISKDPNFKPTPVN